MMETMQEVQGRMSRKKASILGPIFWSVKWGHQPARVTVGSDKAEGRTHAAYKPGVSISQPQPSAQGHAAQLGS